MKPGGCFNRSWCELVNNTIAQPKNPHPKAAAVPSATTSLHIASSSGQQAYARLTGYRVTEGTSGRKLTWRYPLHRGCADCPSDYCSPAVNPAPVAIPQDEGIANSIRLVRASLAWLGKSPKEDPLPKRLLAHTGPGGPSAGATTTKLQSCGCFSTGRGAYLPACAPVMASSGIQVGRADRSGQLRGAVSQ